MKTVLSFLQTLAVGDTREHGVWTVTCTHPDMYRIARTDRSEFVYGGYVYEKAHGRSDSIAFIMINAVRMTRIVKNG